MARAVGINTSRSRSGSLDEPSMGLAPIFVEKIFEINAEETPILLVEQNALMTLDAANRGYVLELEKSKQALRELREKGLS